MTTTDNNYDLCDNCGQLFESGEGISGFDKNNYRKDYDWNCATKLQLAVNDNGELLPYSEVFPADDGSIPSGYTQTTYSNYR